MRVIIMVNFTAGDRFLAFFARFTCHTPLLPYLHDSRINNYHDAPGSNHFFANSRETKYGFESDRSLNTSSRGRNHIFLISLSVKKNLDKIIVRILNCYWNYLLSISGDIFYDKILIYLCRWYLSYICRLDRVLCVLYFERMTFRRVHRERRKLNRNSDRYATESSLIWSRRWTIASDRVGRFNRTFDDLFKKKINEWN